MIPSFVSSNSDDGGINYTINENIVVQKGTTAEIYVHTWISDRPVKHYK